MQPTAELRQWTYCERTGVLTGVVFDPIVRIFEYQGKLATTRAIHLHHADEGIYAVTAQAAIFYLNPVHKKSAIEILLDGIDEICRGIIAKRIQ